MRNVRRRPSWFVVLACLLACCALAGDAAAQNPLGEPPLQSTPIQRGFDPFDEAASPQYAPSPSHLSNQPLGGVSPSPGGYYLPPAGVFPPPGGFLPPPVDGRALESIQMPSAATGLDSPPVELVPPWSTPQSPYYPSEAPSAVAPGPSGAKPGIWQRTRFDSVWLASGDAEGLGINHLGLSTSFAFPFFTRESPLVLTPSFAVRYFNGPDAPDLPARVYDAALEFRWLRPITARWAADVAVAPGVYSDFEQTNSDALRITGRGLVQFTGSNGARWVAGVGYFDRQDVKLLPVGGVIWEPNDATSIELIFPSPQVARRFACGASAEWWGYVGGEFGGGSWAIERASGVTDEVSYRDFRVKLGVERKTIAGVSGQVEVGYVFGRQLEYRSGTPDFEPDDTVMLRSGWSY